YAADDAQPEKLRVEALNLLQTFPKPFARDRVAGVYRPLEVRSAQPAIASLTSAFSKLIGSKSRRVQLAAVEAAEQLKAAALAASLDALSPDKDSPANLRGAALRALAAVNDPKLADAIKLALTDKDAALRVE